MSWAHEKRRKLKAKRDDWYLLNRVNRSFSEAVQDAVQLLSGEGNLRNFLAINPILIKFYDNSPNAYVFHVIRNEKDAYQLLLPSIRNLGLVESFAHELGHVYSWILLRSKGQPDHHLHFYEEMFAVEFGEKWSAFTGNRIIARKLLILAKNSGKDETRLFL
jgi:hypothetical protein